jgi:hypothetical protein
MVSSSTAYATIRMMRAAVVSGTTSRRPDNWRPDHAVAGVRERNLKIKVQSAVEHEIEVALPIYRRHSLECGDIYTRIIERGGKTQHWSQNGPTFELEINDDYRFDSRSDADYNCGTGEYASSRDEFSTALEELQAAVSGVRLAWPS